MSQLFTQHELAVLRRVRSRFLDGSNTGGGYWQNDEELGLYDAVFAERIGWKWDAVIRELDSRGWQPESTRIIDFGCGTGVASRRICAAYPGINEVSLADVSHRAIEFATRRLQIEHPSVQCGRYDQSQPVSPGTMLIVSHVVNELAVGALSRLLELARSVDEIIWVEAGSHADSRKLGAIRDALLPEFSVVAPCPHQNACGIFSDENANHWCHFFTPFPSHAAQDSRWSQVGRELEIDLRALPYSFLVLQKRAARGNTGARVIGTPEERRGHFEVLACDKGGVRELMVQKRDVPALFKSLRKMRIKPAYDWTVENGRVISVNEPES